MVLDMSLIRNINVLNSQKGAFGEAIFAELSPILQGSFEYTVSNTDINTNTVSASGTVTQADAMAVCTTGTTTSSKAILQTTKHAKYRTGQGGLVRFTALFTAPVASTSQLIGLADELGSTADFKNGYMIGYVGTVFGFHRFQNDAVFTTALADWDDPLDGTGASGVTLDKTKLNVFYIQFQYLGGGAQFVYYETPSTGKVNIVATIPYANTYTTPSVYMPNFHFFMYANNKATTNSLIVKSASYAYFVEGRTGFIEIQQPQYSTGIQTKTTVTTQTAIATIKNKTTYASKTNFIDIIIERIVVAIEANAANNLGVLRLVKNATLGGVPSYSDINATNSVVSMDTAGTTVTGGTVLLSVPLAGKNDKVIENLLDYKIILGPGDTLTLSGESVNSATISTACLWKELV